MVFANVGITSGRPTTVARVDETVFEKVLEVNLLGVGRIVRACLPLIIARKGHVLITASIYAFSNGVANAPYVMSKAAVEMFGRAQRSELAGTGATAGVLYPGWIQTPLIEAGFGGNSTATAMLNRAFPWPYNKAVAPEIVARAVVLVAGQRRARIITPRWWSVLAALRGVVGPAPDLYLDKDRKFHKMVRALEDNRTT